MDRDDAPRHDWHFEEIDTLKDEIRKELGPANRTVYVLVQGFYSDQKVAGVFSTRSLAEEFMKLDESERRLQEFPLDELTERARQGLHEWSLCMWRTGVASHIHNCGMSNQMHPASVHMLVSVNTDEPTLYLHCLCWAHSKEHAVKITNDIRAQIIAAGNWREGYAGNIQESPNVQGADDYGFCL